jgi:hypothetical protein
MPTYERGDYVKVEFQDETAVIGEWMWVRVHHCDDEKQLIFGTLGSQLVNDYGGKVELGSELAVSYSQIREHKKPSDFTSKNWGPPSACAKFAKLSWLSVNWRRDALPKWIHSVKSNVSSDSDAGMPCGKRGVIRNNCIAFVAHLQWAKKKAVYEIIMANRVWASRMPLVGWSTGSIQCALDARGLWRSR